jgi:hypothetical protein
MNIIELQIQKQHRDILKFSHEKYIFEYIEIEIYVT